MTGKIYLRELAGFFLADICLAQGCKALEDDVVTHFFQALQVLLSLGGV